MGGPQPNIDLDDEQLLRYSRHILLPEIGIEGQQRLSAAHALVIGAGGLGSPVSLYLAASGVGRITLCDHDKVDLTNLQRQIAHDTTTIGRPKVESARAALARINPEAQVVQIATPTGLHAEHVLDVARFARHVVVEKPMALRVEDARAMAAAVKRSGRRLFVVQQNRFNTAVQAARRALDEGRFGKLVLGTARVRWRREQEYYEQDDWHGTWRLDGGVMSQQASHHLGAILRAPPARQIVPLSRLQEIARSLQCVDHHELRLPLAGEKGCSIDRAIASAAQVGGAEDRLRAVQGGIMHG